jgi:hypothetical protein
MPHQARSTFRLLCCLVSHPRILVLSLSNKCKMQLQSIFMGYGTDLNACINQLHKLFFFLNGWLSFIFSKHCVRTAMFSASWFFSFWAIHLILWISHPVCGHQHSWDEKVQNGNQTLHKPATPIKPTRIVLDGTVIITNTTGAFQGDDRIIKRDSVAGTPSGTKSTFLVLARDASSAYSAYSGLNDYGIPYEVKIIPSGGTSLPVLQSNDADPVGNYGGIVVLSEVSYSDASGNWASAITAAQWTTLYNYQLTFGVRMVRLDVSPSAATGTRVVGSCCADSQEQNVYISDTSQFPTAGLKQWASKSKKKKTIDCEMKLIIV